MWKVISNVFGGGFATALDSAAGLARVFVGDKAQRQAGEHDENMAVREQYAAEFANIYVRSPWDSLIDGMNRLQRPLIVFGVIGLFVWCILDPTEFLIRMQALDLVPEPLWVIIGTVIAFLFGSRSIIDAKKAGKSVLSAEDLKAVITAQRELQALRDPPVASKLAMPTSPAPDTETDSAASVLAISQAAESPDPLLSETVFQQAMEETARPLSNAVIAEWNRRRKAKP